MEEDLKLMKNRLSVENWSGKSLEAVQQDFHAKIFAKNLTLALVHHSEARGQEAPAQKKYPYQINVAQIWPKMKDTIVLLFLKAGTIPLAPPQPVPLTADGAIGRNIFGLSID